MLIILSAFFCLINIFFRTFIKIKKEQIIKIEFYISFLLLMCYYSGIHETNDNENYFLIFNNLKDFPDLGYKLITNFVKYINGGHYLVIWLYYLTTVISYLNFIKNYSYYSLFITLNVFIYTLFYNTNQIRYFLSFYLFLNTFVYFSRKKNKVGSIIVFLSLIFHKGMFINYIFFYLKKYEFKKYIKIIFCLSIFNYFSFKIIEKIVILNENYFGNFKFYFSPERHLSFLGWLYSIVFVLIWWIYIYILNKKIKKSDCFICDKECEELLKLTIFPLIFIFIAFFTRDIFVRFITIFQIVNLVYITNILKFFKRNVQKIILIVTLILSLGNYFYYFELGDYLGIKTHKKDLLKIYSTYKLNDFFDKIVTRSLDI